MLLLEMKTLDTRLEHTRTRNAAAERKLLTSITERDILDPIQVVSSEKDDTHVILDGFKRYRCALKLKMGTIPAVVIANSEVEGIFTFIRRHQHQTGLNILDQAALVEELHTRYHLSIYDIAKKLDRAPSWVSMRLGMLKDLTPFVRKKIMSGAFPARVYMYSIKGFTRVNMVPKERIETFETKTQRVKIKKRKNVNSSHAQNGHLAKVPGIQVESLEASKMEMISQVTPFVHWKMKVETGHGTDFIQRGQ